MRLIGLLAAATALTPARGDEDTIFTIAAVLGYAFLRTLRPPEERPPHVVSPKLPSIDSEQAGLPPFESALHDSINQTKYLLTLTAPGEEPWQVYSVSDLIGRKAFFKCDNVVYSDWHRSNWGKEPYRSFLHWQAEWHKTAEKDCYFVMSEASEEPPANGLEFFGRYPAGLQLMYLIKTGVIATGEDPWLLYLDTDLSLTRPGDVVSDMVKQIEGASRNPNGTLEELYTHSEPTRVNFEDIALVIASDVGCAFKRDAKWPRLNSGTLLFRPVPYTAYIFEATVESWLLQRTHQYDRLDQAMLTRVLTDAFDFPHQTLRRMCRSDPKPWITLGADEALWRDSCEGRQLIFARALDYARAYSVSETRPVMEKWIPTGRPVGPDVMVLACNRVLGGSLAGTPWWVSNDLWNWQCGDVGMHMIGGMGVYGAKFRTLVPQWREKHFANCTQELAMKTMLDGSPILQSQLPEEAKRLNPRLGGGNSMKPFTAREKIGETLML